MPDTPPTDDARTVPNVPVSTRLTRLYLIEDDPTVVLFVQQALQHRPHWRLVGHAGSLAQARQEALHCTADVFLVDLGLPDGCGEEALQELARHQPEAELLVFTVFGEESRLVAALQAGATGYVLKGCSESELVAAIDQILAGGAPISPLLARLLLKQFRPPPAARSGAGQALLSEREVDVLQLVARGYVNKEIAQRLGISPTTVSTHIKNLYRKLSVHTRVQVVRAAQARGLL